MYNKTFGFTTPASLEQLLKNESLEDTNRTLIQLFSVSSEKETIQKLHTLLANYFKNAIFIGATTDGIIENEHVYTDEQSLITITNFQYTIVNAALIEHKDYQYNSYESGCALANKLLTPLTKVIIALSDGTNTNGEEFVNGINSINSQTILSGGMAGDNGAIKETFVFTREGITSNGVVGLALDSERLHVATNFTFDWIPIGKKLKITKSIKNRVYEIDGKSAVDIYAKYMGKEVAEQLPQIGIEFPLIFERKENNKTLLVGRAVLFKHNDGSLTFAGNMPEGAEVRFGVGSVASILKNSNYNVQKILEQMEYKPEAVFIYSCMARRRFMNHYMADELSILKNIGDISGFFTYGEFFHTPQRNELLNETITLLSLSEENEKSPIKYIKDHTPVSSLEDYDFGVNTEHVISHLANVVSNELAELNENLEKRIEESATYIYKQAYFDKLTGLPNRLSLLERLESSVGQIIFLVNIDDFTAINDFYGHIVGDKILQKLADVLDKFAKEEDAESFKLPADEYALLLNIPYNIEAIESKIKKLFSVVEKEKFIINGHHTHISITISAALTNVENTGFVNADMALKSAKKSSMPYMIFAEDLKLAKQYEANIKMANRVKNAIAFDWIVPFYQPIYNVKTKKIEKYEALVRLIDIDKVVHSPYEFLEVSQKIKLYPQITKIMIEKTFSYFAKNGLNFSINLAFSDILDEKIREYLFDKIDHYKIASQLTIEILETQEIDKEDIIKTFIDDVYAHGASIAIDDFGSGFANFEHMTSIRSDYMKIDGSLIKNIDNDSNARLVVETIVIFAQKLGKKTVAEFVHSQEIFEIVKAIGVDFAQGYYLGKPAPDVL